MRLEKLDIFRGIAIVLMVLFHLNYSLVYMFGIETLNFSTTFWYIIWKIAALGFISIAGISFFLAEKKYGGDVWKKYWKYAVVLGLVAGSISFITHTFFPEQYIRFGILHFFAFSFFLLPLFSRLRYWNILLGFSIIIYGMFFISVISSEYFYFLGFVYPGFTSADYYPFFPYFGVILLGYSLGMILGKYRKLSIFQKIWEKNRAERLLIWCGKNSLVLYLVHQPIIIWGIFILQFFSQ